MRINGEDHELAKGSTLEALVAQLGLTRRRLAVELNRTVVRRDQWGQTELHEGDQIEIVHFVGGG